LDIIRSIIFLNTLLIFMAAFNKCRNQSDLD
jgi:hypothetical protein